MNRVARDGAFAHRDAWKFGLAATNWVVWQVSSVVGIVGAAFIPTEWGLQFAGALALLALVMPGAALAARRRGRVRRRRGRPGGARLAMPARPAGRCGRGHGGCDDGGASGEGLRVAP